VRGGAVEHIAVSLVRWPIIVMPYQDAIPEFNRTGLVHADNTRAPDMIRGPTL